MLNDINSEVKNKLTAASWMGGLGGGGFGGSSELIRMAADREEEH